MRSVANFFTFANVSLGLLSILSSITNRVGLAISFMLVAALCDWLDGKFARYARTGSLLGIQLDSLADIIAFGAAPVIFGYTHNSSIIALAGYVVFICCGIYRLARFNIQKSHAYYVGMPITMNVLIVSLIYIVGLPVGWWPFVYLASAGLMVSRFKITKIF
jgi:CDP-diacylglycerol--serine O-phosphatidyltransferase